MKEGGLAVVGLIAASVVWVSQFSGAEVLVNSSQHSFLESEALQAVMAASDPVPADEIPRLGAFYSAKYGVNGPPMPSSMGYAAWNLGDGNYLVDDLDEDNPKLAAASPTGMMAMAMMSGPPSPGGDSGTNSGGGYPQANYTPITNGLRFIPPVISGTTAYLTIVGTINDCGNPRIPFDILVTTNVAEPIRNWSWLGLGYTVKS